MMTRLSRFWKMLRHKATTRATEHVSQLIADAEQQMKTLTPLTMHSAMIETSSRPFRWMTLATPIESYSGRVQIFDMILTGNGSIHSIERNGSLQKRAAF